MTKRAEKLENKPMPHFSLHLHILIRIHYRHKEENNMVPFLQVNACTDKSIMLLTIDGQSSIFNGVFVIRE